MLIGIEGVLYVDKRRREILHIPLFFIVINYVRREPEVILELERLDLWLKNWKKRNVSLRELIGYPEISKKDIDAIVEFIFDRRADEAKSYCIDVFDDIVNREYGINSKSRKYRRS